MDQRSLKVFIACALGAGIGALTALEVTRAFWWVGLFLGGLVGYLCYDPMVVARAARTAWREVRGWEPDRAYWRAVVLNWGAMTMGIMSFLTLLVAFDLADSLTEGRHHGLAYDESMLSMIFKLMSGFCFLLALAEGITYRNDEKFLRMRERAILFGNPVAVVLFWPVYGIIWSVSRVPQFLRLVGRFTATFFRLIHSDLRLLCALDAALGAAVGYFTGNALVGALIGGAIGVANFEIISKRVWKLIPR